MLALPGMAGVGGLSRIALAAGGIAAAAGAVAAMSQSAERPVVAGPAALATPDHAMSFVPQPFDIIVASQPPPPDLTATPPTNVPEPASLAIFLFGASGALLVRRRKLRS